MPLVRTDGRAGGVGSRDCQISWMGSLPRLPMVLRCARFARESSAKNVCIQYVGRPKRKANESLKGMYVAKAKLKYNFLLSHRYAFF